MSDEGSTTISNKNGGWRILRRKKSFKEENPMEIKLEIGENLKRAIYELLEDHNYNETTNSPGQEIKTAFGIDFMKLIKEHAEGGDMKLEVRDIYTEKKNMEVNEEISKKTIDINNKKTDLARYRNRCMLAKICTSCGGQVIELEEKLEHTFMSDYKYKISHVCTQCGCHFDRYWKNIIL